VLLKRIAKEKARLIKEGKIKKQKPLPEITVNEKPFDLPEGWEWIRLGSAGLGSTGKTPSTSNSKYYNGEIPFIGPGQISPEGDISESDKTLTEEGCEYSVITEPSNILMVCIGGSIGKSAIARSKVAFNQQINCIRPLIVDSTYFNAAMKTPHFQAAILDAATGSATPIINRSRWEKLLVALPPLAEQHRIVAKVDELMALCYILQERLNDAQSTQVQLADAIVEQAVA
jgi:type I restriction enzyme S subunit